MRQPAPSCFLIWIVASVGWSTAMSAQIGPGPDRTATPVLDPARGHALAQSMVLWAEEFDAGRLDPRGRVRCSAGTHPIYGTAHGPNAELRLLPGEGIFHVDALRYLVFAAEKYPIELIAESLLRVAAAGLDRPMSDKSAKVVRDTAHFALLRSGDAHTWPGLMRIACGLTEVEDLSDLLSGAHERADDEARPVLPTLRVAALRVLGDKNLPAFRGPVENGLMDSDPRVRLSAAIALQRMKNRRSLPVAARAFATEQHPTVAEAILSAIDKIIRANVERLHPDRIQHTTRTVLRGVGRIGWRTDIDIIRLAEVYPCRAAIPEMIKLMRNATHEDVLVEAVNERASETLRHRALVGLRRMTGAIEPDDTPESWEKFWIRERTNFKFDERPRPRKKPNTSSAFFGIPVTGEEFAFVVDTSGSMREPCEYGRDTRSRSKDPPSRIDVAKAQILKAVHAMDTASRYHLITFHGGVTTWNQHPVPPNPRSHASLTALLAKIQPGGGTNLSGGLETALDPEDLKFGQIRTNHIDEVFVLSDGQPSAGIQDTDALLELVKRLNPAGRVRVHTVFAGNHGEDGEELLQRLAKDNGGVFVRVN